MKHLILTIYTLALLALGACTKEQIDHTNNANGNEETKMVSAAIIADADDTRLGIDGNITHWEVGDKLSVALTDTSSVTSYYTFEIESSEDISDDGKFATFRGLIAEGTYSKVTALYPAVESPTATIILNRHAEDNIFMESTQSYTAGEYLVINSTSADIPLQFSHLMHKIDYTLTLASGYNGTDISKDVAIEMALRSNDAEYTSVQCYNYDTVNGGIGSAVASAPSTLADFTSHDFTTTPTASTFVFPTQLDNASLVFNVYIKGRKAHTIVKTPSKSPFTMTEGKSTSVKLELSEENKCEAETTEGGGSASIEGVNTYLTQIVKSTITNTTGATEFAVKGPNGISFILCVATDYSDETGIDVGKYDMVSASSIWQNRAHVGIRRLTNVPNISRGTPNGGDHDEGYMEVAKSDDGTYTIKIVIADLSSVAEPLGFIGKLNVENGGQTGSGSSTAVPDITLTTLSSRSEGGYYTFYGGNSVGDYISFNINSKEAYANSINDGIYEYSSCNLEGYFNATSVKVGGVNKAVKSGVLHVANSGGGMVLNADITFSDNTTRHFVFSGAISTPVVEGDITITASQSTITNNGLDYVDFSATQDGNIVTNACTFYANGEVLDSSRFSSSIAGKYTIYATKGTKRSNELTITVKEYLPSTLTLSASKTTMVANGTDMVTFTIKADSNLNVTSLCEIYVNGSKNNGTTFKTGSAGTYSVYAMYKGVKSNTITVTANASEKVIVFAEGVTLTSGWYDVNKKAQGNNGDINMCWAATSSNMIQWFQDRYKAAGKTLPAGAVDGPGVTSYTNYGPYELELMNVFHSEWDNSRGGHMQEAIPWYFEGKLNGGEFASPGSQAVPKTAGGYWKSIWDTEVYPNIYHGYENVIVPGVEGLDLKNLYITIFNNYYLWGSGTSYLGVERLEAFSNLIVETFRYGMAGLTINLGANLNAASHAVTLWGYEIDNATGLVTRLWITDSDDLMTEPKTPLLNEYSVSIDEGKANIKLTGNTRYGACYVVSIHPFAGYGIGVEN